MNVMKISKYVRAERRIAVASRAEIIERWSYGRALLQDPTMTTPAGHLRHGVSAALIHSAATRALKLTETELQRRLRAARTYSGETEIRRAAADSGGWWALVEAGFPAPDSPTEPALINPEGHVNPAAEPWHQASLDDDEGVFPRIVRVSGVDHDRDRAPLSTLRAYLEGCERWTASHVRRNERMRRHLAALAEAAGGDWETRYVDAARDAALAEAAGR